MSRDIESKKRYGFRRLFNKILQAIAKSSLLSGYMRARLENVFIGFNCVIAKPVSIGKNSVLGANTVITKDVPPDSIIVLPESINLKKV